MSDPAVLYSLKSASLDGTPAPRLSDVSLELPAGFTCIAGYSGAGKTSLLNLLAGYERPDRGSLNSGVRGDPPAAASRSGDHRGPGSTQVAVSGRASEDTVGETLPAARLPLFWVPQNGGLWPHLTVEDHLNVVRGGPSSSGGETAGPPDRSIPEETADLTDEILAEFDLSHRSRAIPAELSQGERSRLSVARALAAQPRVLLLDEPLAHVDVARRLRHWDAILRRAAASEMSVIFASHDPALILRGAHRVVCLESGRIVFQGTTETLFCDPPTESIALLLGPVNWFAGAEERQMWLGEIPAGSRMRNAVRPAFVGLAADGESQLELQGTAGYGTHAESRLRHLRTGEQRTIAHREQEQRPPSGRRVRLWIEQP